MLSDKFRSILGREPQQQYQELSPSPDTDISSIESNEKCCAHCSQNAENTTTPTRGILLRHAQRVVLIISLVFNLAMLAIWMVPLKDSPPEQSKGLRSDAFFGDIPMHNVVWEKDSRFTDSDPWDGAFWNNGTAKKGSTPWDDLFRTGWIEVAEPSRYGLEGGLPLAQFAVDHTWPDDGAGFNPSVLHQIHCVGIFKHLATSTGANVLFDEHELEHAHHCAEYLRQAVMCNADLTLEPPSAISEYSFKGTSGWGTAHHCRDWDTVHDFLWKRLIRFHRVDGRMKVFSDAVG